MFATFVLCAAAFALQDAAPKEVPPKETAPREPAEPGPIAGIYQGTLDAGAASLRLAVHIERTPKGFTAALDSLDQGAFDIGASSVEVKERHVKLAWAMIGATMEGDVANDGQSFDARFKQGA